MATEQDKRCGTCRWWDATPSCSVDEDCSCTEIGDCSCPVPNSVPFQKRENMWEGDGTDCPTWAAKDEKA